jgi:hypothetical protein
VVRLNAKLLALGHVTNPRQNHHPVRLAPASADRRLKAARPPVAGTNQRTPEGPERRVSPVERDANVAPRSACLDSGPSPDRRSPRAGSPRMRVPTQTDQRPKPVSPSQMPRV